MTDNEKDVALRQVRKAATDLAQGNITDAQHTLAFLADWLDDGSECYCAETSTRNCPVHASV